jgi:hypothetical protein
MQSPGQLGWPVNEIDEAVAAVAAHSQQGPGQLVWLVNKIAEADRLIRLTLLEDHVR